MTPETLLSILSPFGIDEVAGVPDSLLADFTASARRLLGPGRFTICANEGLAVSWAAARQMATGRPALVFLQNSGLGNCVNPLLSLTHGAVYRLPVFLLVGWRGQPGTQDEPQHRSQGEATMPLLRDLGIPAEALTGDSPADEAAVRRLASTLRDTGTPVALVVPKGTLACDGPRPPLPKPYAAAQLSREEAIRVLVRTLPRETRFVATTGMISRELYALRDTDGTPHDHDFLTVGSMGHASTLALALALEHPALPFVCLDGDGALLMHAGALALLARKNPHNLTHVVLDNASHDTVGGVPTGSESLALPAIARSFGYPHAAQTESAEGICAFFGARRLHPGLAMLVVRVRPGHRSDLPRPRATPVEAKSAFLDALRIDNPPS